MARPDLSKAPEGEIVITPRFLVDDILEGPAVGTRADEGTIMECNKSTVKRKFRMKK